jgi:hypothetical protein
MVVGVLVISGCAFKLSFRDGAIDASIETVSIANFPNNAQLVTPILSSAFTDALQDKFARETRLALIPEDGDMNFEGAIVGYTSNPMSISGGEYAQTNRLTISVRVRFTNKKQPEYDFDRTFSAYSDYSSDQLLQSVEGSLIPDIVDQLVEDIFTAATSNW